LSSILLLKNRILTSFLPQKSAYNILLGSRRKSNEEVITRYILSNNNGNEVFLQINNFLGMSYFLRKRMVTITSYFCNVANPGV